MEVEKQFAYDAPCNIKIRSTESITNSQAIIPAQYYQRHYPPYENGCVWLATCQLMFSLNKDLANQMIQEYEICSGKYEFIRIFESKRLVENSLYEYM